MEEQNEVQAVQENKRPVFLTVLCILTFVGSGLALLFALIGLVAAGAIESFAASIPGMPDLGDVGIFTQIIRILLYAGSLFGAIMMLKLKKLGFYLYVVANVVLLVMSFGIMGLVITAGFIVMYGLNFKAME